MLRVIKSINQQKLFAQWSTALATHGDSGANPYTAKERQVKKRMLVLDACVLTPDQDAGSLTVFNHIKIFQSLGYKVTFAAGQPAPGCEIHCGSAATRH